MPRLDDVIMTSSWRHQSHMILLSILFVLAVFWSPNSSWLARYGWLYSIVSRVHFMTRHISAILGPISKQISPILSSNHPLPNKINLRVVFSVLGSRISKSKVKPFHHSSWNSAVHQIIPTLSQNGIPTLPPSTFLLLLLHLVNPTDILNAVCLGEGGMKERRKQRRYLSSQTVWQSTQLLTMLEILHQIPTWTHKQVVKQVKTT